MQNGIQSNISDNSRMNPNNKGKARTPITNNNNNYPQIQMDKHHKIIIIIKKIWN